MAIMSESSMARIRTYEDSRFIGVSPRRLRLFALSIFVTGDPLDCQLETWRGLRSRYIPVWALAQSCQPGACSRSHALPLACQTFISSSGIERRPCRRVVHVPG